jgi:peptidyl-prolyl cis-trans isomerase SurA
MRLSALLSIAAVAAVPVTVVAQQPAAAPALQTSTSQPIPLDRIVAVVGDVVITQSTLQERVVQKKAEGVAIPADSAGYRAFLTQTLNEIIDEELLLAKAKELKIEVPEVDITSSVDKQYKEVRKRFASDAEFRSELLKAGYGTPEEYRRFMADGLRRNETITRTTKKLHEDGKIQNVNVTDADIKEAFERNKAILPKREDALTFRQIILAPKPSAANRELARAKAESLLVQLKAGADFEKLAKKESMDPGSKEQGGDLGWNRRGKMVPEFDRWMFALAPGQLSPVVETGFGFHIIRVDRVNPAEVKARHILIRPTIDSSDVAHTKLAADSVAAQLRNGVSFDTLAKKYHDFKGGEETLILNPIPKEKLPAEYKAALGDKQVKDIVVFQIPGNEVAPPKWVVAQVATVVQGGDLTLAEFKERFKDRLAQEAGVKRLMDGLRKGSYVTIQNDALPAIQPPL